MFKKPEPKALTAEQLESLTTQYQQQTGKSAVPKTYDPSYPVFEIPVNGKELIYVPNHVVMDAMGELTLRKDKFFAHQVLDRKSRVTVRCNSGVELEELNLDKSCPLCDAMQTAWELYNLEYAEIAKSKSIAIDSPEAKDGLSQVRKDLLGDMVVKPAEAWLTFPIIVFECMEKDGNKVLSPKRDKDGRLIGKPMWYSIREKGFIERWAKTLETATSPDGSELPPTHPGGLWFILNYTYESKDGKHDKMQSAKNLAVNYKPMVGYSEWETYYDELTKDWTPAKAMETVCANVLRSKEEQQEVCDEIVKPALEKIAMLKMSKAKELTGSTEPQTSAEAALASFGAVPQAQATPDAAPQVPTGLPQVPLADTNLGVN